MANYIREFTDAEIVDTRRRARRGESAEDIMRALGLDQHRPRGFREMLRSRYGIVVPTSGSPRARAHEGANTCLGNPRVSAR